jgi:hypothetical protein
MNAFEFSKHAIELYSRYDFIKTVDILLLDEPVVKIKAHIDEDTYLNVFYNSETAKYSFALIRNNKRIFGVDNTRKWHIHPFENPDLHKEISPMSLEKFLEVLETDKDKWAEPLP